MVEDEINISYSEVKQALTKLKKRKISWPKNVGNGLTKEITSQLENKHHNFVIQKRR